MNSKGNHVRKEGKIPPEMPLSDESTQDDQIARSNIPSFSDIQTLCSFIFLKPFDEITTDDIASIKNSFNGFEEMGKRTGIYPETLQKIAIQALYFKDRLEFKETEAGIEDILLDELNLTKL